MKASEGVFSRNHLYVVGLQINQAKTPFQPVAVVSPRQLAGISSAPANVETRQGRSARNPASAPASTCSLWPQRPLPPRLAAAARRKSFLREQRLRAHSPVRGPIPCAQRLTLHVLMSPEPD